MKGLMGSHLTVGEVYGFGAWITRAWLPFLPQPKIPMQSWLTSFPLWDGPVFGDPEDPLGGCHKGERAPTQFLYGASRPLRTIGFCIELTVSELNRCGPSLRLI